MVNTEDYIKLLDWRYATKVFDTDKKIPVDQWEAILKSLHLSPSAFGLQLWQFIDVQDSDVRAQLRGVSWNQPQVTDASHFLVFCVRRDVTKEDVANHVERIAEVRKVNLESLSKYQEYAWGAIQSKEKDEQRAWLERQVYIALGFAMHAAAVLGLDTCAIEGMEPVEYDKILKLTDTPYRAVCGLALGYRSSSDKYAELAKVRFSFDSVIKTI